MSEAYCTDCVFRAKHYVDEIGRCWHIDRSEPNYIVGGRNGEHCIKYNENGECKLFEKGE